MKNSKKTAVVAKSTETKTTMVHLCKTTYHYWRNGWLKEIFQQAKINSVKWKKNETGYEGVLIVASTDVVTAQHALDDYKKKNTDVKEIWW